MREKDNADEVDDGDDDKDQKVDTNGKEKKEIIIPKSKFHQGGGIFKIPPSPLKSISHPWKVG